MDPEVIDLIKIDTDDSEDDMPNTKELQEKEKNKSGKNTAEMDNLIELVRYKYMIPTLSLTDLVFLILKNCNCLLSSQIWNYLSGLFPYYECTYTPLVGNTKIVSIISKRPKLFLRTDSLDGSLMKLVVLNPAVRLHKQFNIIRAKAVLRRSNLNAAVYKIRLLDDFLDGKLDLNTVELFRARLRPHSFCEASFGPTTSENVASFPDGPIKKRKRRSKPQDIAKIQNAKKAAVIDDAKELEREECMDFNPQIIECQTVDPLEIEQMDPTSLGMFDASNILDTFNCPSADGETIDFANCVWSNNSQEDSIIDVGTPQTPPKQAPSFPEVEKCIPKWREIFPWVTWLACERTIGCRECQHINRKCGLPDTLAVAKVRDASKIFNVAKVLRQHGDKMSHRVAKIIAHKQLISVLHNLLNFHFSDFDSTADILESCKAICSDSSTEINRESIYFASKLIGEYLEYRVIQSVKKAQAFSVIADVCSGIVIVRLANETGDVEEHIVASYMSCDDKSPLDYLTSLGVDTTKMLQYLANDRCESCTRCSKLPKLSVKSLSPMRFPHIGKFLLFLWKTTLLMPVHALCCTVRKLWKSYPHRFRNVTNLQCIQLDRFNYNPSVLVAVYENITEIKSSAKTIYEINGNVEALGLYQSTLRYKNFFVKIFPFLSKIISHLAESKDSASLINRETLLEDLEHIRYTCIEWKDKISDEEYSILSSQVTEVSSLVNLTVNEFCQPIYFKGRTTMSLALPILFRSETLFPSLCQKSLTVSKPFDTVFAAIKHSFTYEKEDLYAGLVSFVKSYPKIEGCTNIAKMIELLNVDPKRREENKEVYEFLSFLNLLPFGSPSVSRCLYEIKVYINLFPSSAWCGFGFDLQSHLLMILSELNSKHRLSDVEMFRWMKSKYL